MFTVLLSSCGSRVSPGTSKAPGPLGLGGTEVKNRFPHPPNPCFRSLGFLQRPPKTGGPMGYPRDSSAHPDCVSPLGRPQCPSAHRARVRKKTLDA